LSHPDCLLAYRQEKHLGRKIVAFFAQPAQYHGEWLRLHRNENRQILGAISHRFHSIWHYDPPLAQDFAEREPDNSARIVYATQKREGGILVSNTTCHLHPNSVA
jgi:hypothetical protein